MNDWFLFFDPDSDFNVYPILSDAVSKGYCLAKLQMHRYQSRLFVGFFRDGWLDPRYTIRAL
jgi:hypothetical protein